MNHPIEIYTTQDGNIRLQVSLDHDTVWLTQAQMAMLFDTSVDNISLHLKNIYREAELSEAATVEDYSIVRTEGSRQVKRLIKHYNLDAIISVGYRISSRRATQFRQWATRTLKQHLVDGYTLHEQRLRERGIEFSQVLDLLGRTLHNQTGITADGAAVLAVVQEYAKSWSLLQAYDEQSLAAQSARQHDMRALEPAAVAAAIAELKAAHLLYFVIKNHPFADGNKRSGAFLFLWYLRLNAHLLAKPVEQLVNDNTLVALALLVAESDPAQKELIIRLIEHFIVLKEAL